MPFLGLDVGTTGSKSVVFDESGNIVTTSYVEYTLHHRRPELSELNPKEVWPAVKSVLRESLEKERVDPKKIQALSASVLGEAFMPVSREGEPLYWSMTTFDARASEQAAWWEENFGVEEMYRITGQPLSSNMPIYTLPKLQWIIENEKEVYKKTWKFMCWEDFLFFHLTGNPVMDHSLASRTMMFDITKNQWSQEILETGRIERDLLSDLLPSGHVVGEITEDAARETGLKPGTLVVAGGHDQPAGALGAGIVEEGPLMDATGTVECYGLVQNRLLLKDEMRLQGYALHRYVVKDKFFMFGFNPTGGAILRWYRDNFAAEEKDEAKRKGVDVYDILTSKAAEAAPGALGLVLLPYFEGSGTPRWNRRTRGVLFGLTLSHTRREVIRAILEGLAYQLRMNVETMEDHGLKVTEIHSIGGGARSSFWLQLKADITKKRVLTPKVKMEAVALGAAMLAATGAGFYKNLDEALQNMVSIETVHNPDPSHEDAYEKAYFKYAQICPFVSQVLQID